MQLSIFVNNTISFFKNKKINKLVITNDFLIFYRLSATKKCKQTNLKKIMKTHVNHTLKSKLKYLQSWRKSRFLKIRDGLILAWSLFRTWSFLSTQSLLFIQYLRFLLLCSIYCNKIAIFNILLKFYLLNLQHRYEKINRKLISYNKVEPLLNKGNIIRKYYRVYIIWS